MKLIARFIRDEAGITAIEYALLGVLVALAIIVGATSLGTQLNAAYEAVANSFPSSGA